MSDIDRPDDRPAETPNAVASSDAVTIRRAPKFGVFIVGGALLGVVVTIIVVAATLDIDRGGQAETVGFWGLVGYFSLWGATAGMFVGAVTAVVLDRVLARRSAELTAERVAVDTPPETVDGEIEDEDAR